MSVTMSAPEPSPDEVSRGLAELERHLRAEVAPPVPARLTPPAVVADGETKRVRHLRAEVAEARRLAVLQDDETLLLIDTPKVRKRRKRAAEAARLHALSRQPAQLAYTAAKARRRVNIGLTVALVLALGWSTAGVQVFASQGAPPWSPAWVFAWFVEPFMSIGLLCFVGAKAFFGTRGQAAKDRVLDRIELLFLALTLGMNAFPYLPGVAAEFSFPRLMLHLLGPIVAYAVVTGWPRLLARFAGLDHGLADGDPVTPLTVAAYSTNAAHEEGHRKPFGGVRNGLPESAHRERLLELISSGQLPDRPSARAIQRALGCATETAGRLRDELAGGVA